MASKDSPKGKSDKPAGGKPATGKPVAGKSAGGRKKEPALAAAETESTPDSQAGISRVVERYKEQVVPALIKEVGDAAYAAGDEEVMKRLRGLGYT